MRPIHLARLDKTGPVLVLARPHLRWVTIASTVKGLSVEVPVGLGNGLDHECVVNLDSIQTIADADLGRQVGRLTPAQELLLTEAIRGAFDLV